MIISDTSAVYILMFVICLNFQSKIGTYLLFIQVQEHELKSSGKQQFDRSCSRVMDMDYGLTWQHKCKAGYRFSISVRPQLSPYLHRIYIWASHSSQTLLIPTLYSSLLVYYNLKNYNLHLRSRYDVFIRHHRLNRYSSLRPHCWTAEVSISQPLKIEVQPELYLAMAKPWPMSSRTKKCGWDNFDTVIQFVF